MKGEKNVKRYSIPMESKNGAKRDILTLEQQKKTWTQKQFEMTKKTNA